MLGNNTYWQFIFSLFTLNGSFFEYHRSSWVNKQSMIRIIIADDHKLAREAWSMLLSRDKRLEIIAICENGQEVIDYIKEKEADIILMDINMEPVNGIEATRSIRKFNQQIKIIGISVHTDLP